MSLSGIRPAVSISVLVLAAFPSIAPGGSMESFDTLAPGLFLPQVSPLDWEPWDGAPAAGGSIVTAALSDSPPHALRVHGGDDLVRRLHEFDATSGRWEVSSRVFVPSSAMGSLYFILLNTYETGGAKNWSAQVRLDAAADVIESEFDGDSLPLPADKWFTLRAVIDLDADAQFIYVDDLLLTAKSWTEGVSGGGALGIEAVDFYANGSLEFHFDDIAFNPLPTVAARVLFLAAGDDDLPYRDAIATLNDAQIDFIDGRVRTPTEETLGAYDAVHVWATEDFVDATTAGARLGAYTDVGGCVILGTGCAARLSGTAIMQRSPAVSRNLAAPQHNQSASLVIPAGDCAHCMYTQVTPFPCANADRLMLGTLAGAVAHRAGGYPGLPGPGGVADPEIAGAYWSPGPAVMYLNGSGGPWTPGTDLPCWITAVLEHCHEVKVDDCPPDLDADGQVGFRDVLVVLANWGDMCANIADLDGSGVVDFGDLLIILGTWGPCPE